MQLQENRYYCNSAHQQKQVPVSPCSVTQQTSGKPWETSVKTVIQLSVHKASFCLFGLGFILFDFVFNFCCFHNNCKPVKLRGTASQETELSTQGVCRIFKRSCSDLEFFFIYVISQNIL